MNDQDIGIDTYQHLCSQIEKYRKTVLHFHHLSCYMDGQFVDRCQFYEQYGLVRSPLIRRERIEHVLCSILQDGKIAFAGLPNAESYIDDMTIHTPDWEWHLDAVRRVLDQLHQHSMTARLTKCDVGYNKIKLLTQVVRKGVVKPQGEKVCEIIEVSKPKTKKDLRSFLGVHVPEWNVIRKY